MADIAILAGLGLSAASQIQQGRAAEAQGKFEEKLAARNQQALERQAKAEKEAASIEEGRAARKRKLVMGAQRAAAGKSGFGLAGASMETILDTAYQFAMERNLILRGGLVRSQELQERGQIEMAKGRWASSMGKSQKRASILGAVGTGMMGVGMIGSRSSGFIHNAKYGGGPLNDIPAIPTRTVAPTWMR